MPDCAPSFSSALNVFVAGVCFLNTHCTYAIVFTSQLKLLNCSHWIISFSSIFAKKTIWWFCSSEANNKFTCSGHSFSRCFNQAGPVSHSLLLCSSTMTARVPMSARLLIPLTWFHCETLVVSKISPTLFATNTCCLRWELRIPCRTVVESDQKLQLWIFVSCSFTICSLSFTAITAACSSKRGMERSRIGATLHFPITNAKSAEYSLGFERRYTTVHILSLDASANTWSSHLSLAVLKYLLSMLVSATTGSWSFHFRNSSFPLSSTDLSQCCPFFVQMLFRSRLIWTLNGANSPRASNSEETRENIFLWVIGVSTFLLVPLQTCRLSSIIFYWSPSTDEPSLPGSTSTCFVLLIDLKSSGIALVTTSLLVIHFFSSNPFFERRGWSCSKTLIATDWVLRLTWWNRPCRSCFGLFLLQLGTRPRYRWLLASERSWHMLVNSLLRKNMTLILVNLHRFVHCWSPQEFQAAFIPFRNLHLQKHWFNICG